MAATKNRRILEAATGQLAVESRKGMPDRQTGQPFFVLNIVLGVLYKDRKIVGELASSWGFAVTPVIPGKKGKIPQIELPDELVESA